MLYVDGASNKNGVGAGVVLRSPEGTLLEQAIQLEFRATNNEAEYEALLSGLRLAVDMRVTELMIFSDSQLSVGQVNGEYQAKDERMISYLEQAHKLIVQFPSIQLNQIGREENPHADALASLASAKVLVSKRTLTLESLSSPSISKGQEGIHVIFPIDPSWMDPIISYLKDGNLPENKNQAVKVRR